MRQKVQCRKIVTVVVPEPAQGELEAAGSRFRVSSSPKQSLLTRLGAASRGLANRELTSSIQP